MIRGFASETGVELARVGAACFGVAGPVLDGSAELTNVPWRVDASDVADAFSIRRVALLNDLQAMAYAVPVLEGEELHTLQIGRRLPGGNIAVIAAGTGLGQAFLHNLDGRFIPSPGEGGHADFAARNEREIALLRDLITRFGRASVEHVLSGPGLENIAVVTHRSRTCTASGSGGTPPPAPGISTAAIEHDCAGCLEALEMFVEIYGAEAGNLALRCVATGGVFVGGGIAPKILPALVSGRFMTAFRDKPPHRDLLAAIPVHVILNADAGLVGAAVYATSLLQ
jgi:glucokinase